MSCVQTDTLWRSRPFDVVWAGWTTTTTALQRGGWLMAVSEDPHMWELYFEFRHPEHGIHLASAPYRKDDVIGRGSMHNMRALPADLGGMRGPPIVIRSLLRRGDRFVRYGEDYQVPRLQFDARPDVLHMEARTIDYDDLATYFRPIVVPEEKELIVDPNDVMALLERIKDLQAPKQKELREKARREQARMVHAQIVSVA